MEEVIVYDYDNNKNSDYGIDQQHNEHLAHHHQTYN